MRFIRLVFLFSVLSVFGFSYADTIPATLTTVAKVTSFYEPNSTITGTSRAQICTALLPWVKQNLNSEMTRSYMSTDTICDVTDDVNYRYRYGIFEKQVCPSGAKLNTASGLCEIYTCPSDYTLDSNGTTCTKNADCPKYDGQSENQPATKPANCECPAGSAWYPYGGCRKKCNYNANEDMNAGWDMQYDPKSSNICAQGCQATPGSGVYYDLPGGLRLGKLSSTGWACKGTTESTTQPDNSKDGGKPEDKKKPPCEAGQGVLTSSSGTVACVPEGIPSRPPEVDKRKKVETFPDNSTKETETITTRDPGTGASDTTTRTISSGGLSGTAGTTTSNETSSGNGTGTGSGSGSGNDSGDCSGNDCGGGKDWPKAEGFWEKKYPDGLSGVLNQKMSAMKNTPLGHLVDDLVPSLPNGGTCPSFNFSMATGIANFGTHTLAPPCYVWDFIRIVMLIGAGLLARRLIFGG